jgi:uncharacterized protein YfkK (UPF0435 family)/KaiC/GvpD/RAD55 family RecA-like ATPase
MKIKDLFTFNLIQPVIKIMDISDEKEMIENYVISKNLEEHLLYFLKYLNGEKTDRNTSVNIIGNYGTGKSHFLAFLSLILSKPELRNSIQNPKIKNAFENLKREFLVVKYELGQNLPLTEIFYYRVKKQLKENYDIDFREIDLKTEKKDHKELVEEIILTIKEKYPSKGLIVIFDEYSDFIKQKDSTSQHEDLNFTRQLAESSSNQDFILMLSMQEHIFSDPEYKSNAELISKIEQRFLRINITSENIEDIISKRIVKKDENQLKKIKKLFEDLKPKFTNIALEEDRYAELFPVHPYVIEIFPKLTFHENRTILEFISNEIEKILDKDFPEFVTYDLIYKSLIKSDHTVKNKEEVKPVVQVVQSLKDIVNQIDPKYKKNAIRLIESLAIKNLITPPDEKGEKLSGDTPEKFVENLFILPKSRLINPVDDVTMTLNMLISKSVGQFINKDEENDVYYINLNATVDYEQIITNKASNIRDLTAINQKFVEEFLLNELDFEYEKDISHWDMSKKYVLADTVKWNDRNSFRNGLFIINIGKKLKFEENQDFIVILKGYGENEAIDGDIVIKPKYDDKFSESIKRLIAVDYLIRSNTHLEAMKNKKGTIIDNEVRPNFKEAFLKSKIDYDNKNYSLEDIGINSEISSEIFSQIKEKLLGERLTNEYPSYPRFKSSLSEKNIIGTLNSVIKDVPSEGAVKNLLPQSTNILIPLGLYKDNILDVSESEYAQFILEKVDDTGKNLDINEVINDFSRKPYGLQKEIVYFIIAILLRNGDIMLNSIRGQSYSSMDFGNLFKSGIVTFENIKYIKKEEGPSSKTGLLFDALDLDKSLLQLKKNYSKAFQEYSNKIDNILEDIRKNNNSFNEISSFKYLPLKEINNKLELINDVQFEKLKISNVNAFKNLDYSPENINKIKESYQLIKEFKSLFKDIQEYINSGITYMENTIEWITKDSNKDFFRDIDKNELEKIYNETTDIIKNFRKFIKEDERNPIKGKIEIFKDKYKSIYFNAHEKYLGNDIDWGALSDLEESETYHKLNILKDTYSLNSSLFREIQLKIISLKKLRCDKLRVDELNTNYHCSCLFPENIKSHNIDKEIEKIEETTKNLYNSWINQILEDIQDKKDNIKLLDNEEEKRIIKNIIENNKLPDNIYTVTIESINDLLKDIEIEDIDIEELYGILISDKDTLKIDEFTNKINNYITDKTANLNKETVRIRIIKKEDN